MRIVFKKYPSYTWTAMFLLELTNKAIEVLFSLPFEQILSQQLVLSPDLTIVETTEPVLAQTAHFINIQTLQHEERPLDNLDMILYDAFSEL